MEYIKGQTAKVSFFYHDLSGNPVTGATLTALVRGDNGTWRTTAATPVESSPALAPGFYDLSLNDSETGYDKVDWYARTLAGAFVAQGSFLTTTNPELTTDLIFSALFATPSTPEDQAVQNAFLDKLADHVLRRSQALSEASGSGDTISSNSLLGVIALFTQGQLVATGCNGDSHILINSAIQGHGPLGILRVVRNSQGVPIGVLPLTGPNAQPDSSLNCECA